MPSQKKQPKLNADTPATQHDLALWGGQLALQLEEKSSKEDLKKELQNYPTKQDLKQELAKYATKADLEAMEERLQRNITMSVVTTLQAYIEQLLTNRDEAHHDELDIAMEKKDAPPTWKSIPRRLKVVEMDVEKIKDKLA